jgi:hypothetical protein
MMRTDTVLRRTRRSPRLVVVSGLVTVFLAAPSEQAPALPTPLPAAPVAWASEAVARLTAEQEAAIRGAADLTRLAVPDVRVDARPWSGLSTGREAWLAHLQALYGPTLDERHESAYFVDPSGAAVQQHVASDPRFGGPAMLMDLRSYGPGGMTESRILAATAVLRRSVVAPSAEAFAPLEALVEGYLRAWSEPEATGFEELYAEDAVLLDPVAGRSLHGIGPIASHLRTHARGTPSRVRVTALPGMTAPAGERPAIYLDHRVPAAVTTIALVLTASDGHGCPGRFVTVLDLAEDRIVRERRLRDVDDARRCHQTLPTGWWDRLRGTDEDAATSEIELGDRTVVVTGSAPALDGLVRWALERFEVAGMQPPPVASVAFATATGRCDGIAGQVTMGVSGGDVLLCIDEAGACLDEGCPTGYRIAARLTILHELAHVWEAASIDDEVRAEYLERTGLATWMAARSPWAERGGERAAETIMWGLMDHPIALPRLENPACEQLGDEFRLLTGAEPIVPWCASPAPAVGPLTSATGGLGSTNHPT